MKQHYFKQKIYDVDRLMNRQIYLEGTSSFICQRHQKVRESLKGGQLSVESEMLLKNSAEKRRLAANKEFSENYWKVLKQKRVLGR